MGQIIDIMKLNVVFRTTRFRKYLFSVRSDVKMNDFKLKAKILRGEAYICRLRSLIFRSIKDPRIPLIPAMKKGSAKTDLSTVSAPPDTSESANIPDTRVAIKLARVETAKNLDMMNPRSLGVVLSPTNADHV